MMLPAIFFLLRIALAVCGLKDFQKGFRTCSESIKNIIGIFVKITLLLKIVLGHRAVFKTFIMPVTISTQVRIFLSMGF